MAVGPASPLAAVGPTTSKLDSSLASVFSRAWHHGYTTFQEVGADTFLLVSPDGNMLLTCNPEAAHHFLRDNSLGKPHRLMSLLNVFGPTITGSDGPEARHYRKATAPFFNEKTMSQVWNCSVHGTEALMNVFEGRRDDLRAVLAKLTLHVLNAVSYGNAQGNLIEIQDMDSIPPGHELSYSQAMAATLEHLPALAVTPSPILEYSPFSIHKRAHQAYKELRTYMRELVERFEKMVDGDRVPNLLDLIIQIPENSTGVPLRAGPAAIPGNIFLYMFAGHEANANSLNYLILLLACNPGIQASVQADLDRILGSTAPSDWSYEQHYQPLSTSLIGAVINETSRLFTVLPFLPKTTSSTSQSLVLADKSYLIPPETLIFINTSAIHRHPAIWPPPSEEYPIDDANAPNPLASFNPNFWIHPPTSQKGEGTQSGFLQPIPGSYVPFSDGGRGCLGKKFALVELAATVARIFKEYSVELAVDCGVEDSKEEKLEQWKDARRRAEHEMSAGSAFKLSLRMNGRIPVNFVKREDVAFSEKV